MREFELYLNCLDDVREAVFYVDFDYPCWRLKEFADRTNLEKLIITGTLSEKQAKTLLEPLQLEHTFGRQRLPKELVFQPLNEIGKRGKIQALLFENIRDIREIYPLAALRPQCLIGEMPMQGISAFSLWEKFRNCCDHIQITTKRLADAPQILRWDRDCSSDVELSIIFPMYNVSKYLDQCIQSVTAWKADYIEFLFVNDGSPDNSRDIVLKWAENDSRIRLLDKPNGGCASARQWGLERAKGRYVGFIDPDDFIDESMFRKLLRAAMVGSYEISYCGYNAFYENTGTVEAVDDLIGWPYSEGVSDIKRIKELIAFCRVAIWRGIYKKEMLERANIHFYTEIRRFDDLPFKVETFAAAKSVVAVNEHLYYYRLARPGQDVSADDERLYVHFPIFEHLNNSIASSKEQHLIDCLQICKIQTHRYALEKIKPQFIKEYIGKAQKDLATTGRFFRTLSLAKEMVGKKSAMFYWAIMTRNTWLIRILRK